MKPQNPHIVEINEPPRSDGRRGTLNKRRCENLPLVTPPGKYYCFECECLGFINPPAPLDLQAAQIQHRRWMPNCSGGRIVLDLPLGGAA